MGEPVVVDGLSHEVTVFISKHIHGFSQLELLLHLHDEPERQVTIDVVAREQRMAEDQAAGLLHDLHSRGLLIAIDEEGKRSYRYEPKSQELARQVDALSQTFPKYRHAIVQLIFSKPSESVTNFAEAFRLRKDEDDG
ncbi:MAG: hypothetical protein ACRDI3_07065 [Actinomycetota bacterium]